MDREAGGECQLVTLSYYTPSHDVRGGWRGVHSGGRARGAKIGPSEERGRMRVDVENVSMEPLWALGALEKGLKRPDVRVGVWWKGCRKQPPKAPFSATFSQVQRLMRLVAAEFRVLRLKAHPPT